MDLVRQIVVVVATIGTITVNALANIIPFNGKNTGEISNSFDVFFVPAGYVFAIWSLIYILLIGFTVYQVLPAQRDNELLRTVGWLYVVGSVANSAWMFLWHYEQFPLSVVAMVVLLLSLIGCYVVLGIGQTGVTGGFKWLVHVPFSVYLGWITVATVANVTATLESMQWNGWGISPETWAIIMMIVAVVITAAVLITRRDLGYALVIIWAFVGIAIEQAASRPVSIAAWVLTALVGILAIVMLFVGSGLTQPATT